MHDVKRVKNRQNPNMGRGNCFKNENFWEKYWNFGKPKENIHEHWWGEPAYKILSQSNVGKRVKNRHNSNLGRSRYSSYMPNMSISKSPNVILAFGILFLLMRSLHIRSGGLFDVHKIALRNLQKMATLWLLCIATRFSSVPKFFF